MLMIVLDVTIVNVALPSIQDDLGFSQSSLAWVVNAYLIAFGGLLLLAGRLGDLIGRRTRVPRRPRACSRSRRCCAALAQSQEMLVAARFVQGIGGAMTSAVDPRHDRHDVPRAARAGQGDRRLRVRRLGRRLGRPARRRRAHPGDQLALDLLRQRPDRHRHRRSSPLRLLERDEGIGLRRGRRRPRRRADHRRADARRLHDRQAGRRGRLGRRPARSALGAVSLALLAAFVAREAPRAHAADAAAASSARATSPAPTRSRRCRSPACSACSSSARCTCERVLGYDAARDRPGVPAGDGRDGDAVGALLRAADHALRRARTLLPGPGADRRGAAACSPRRRSTATTSPTCCRSMVLLGAGAGVASPR